jgi:hypothetical protein
MLSFPLLEGANESLRNVSNGVEVVRDLDGGGSGPGRVDRSRILHGIDGS